jgi:hypothetical protein
MHDELATPVKSGNHDLAAPRVSSLTRQRHRQLQSPSSLTAQNTIPELLLPVSGPGACQRQRQKSVRTSRLLARDRKFTGRTNKSDANLSANSVKLFLGKP